uniref:Envelope-like protein n=1 Tax=Steinernema glaseri TaxID=37863 RepID=A0A1I7ZRB0_9BILA
MRFSEFCTGFCRLFCPSISVDSISSAEFGYARVVDRSDLDESGVSQYVVVGVAENSVGENDDTMSMNDTAFFNDPVVRGYRKDSLIVEDKGQSKKLASKSPKKLTSNSSKKSSRNSAPTRKRTPSSTTIRHRTRSLNEAPSREGIVLPPNSDDSFIYELQRIRYEDWLFTHVQYRDEEADSTRTTEDSLTETRTMKERFFDWLPFLSA